MLISLHDLKRAVLGGGDISSFTGIYFQALNRPPFNILPDFNHPLELPGPLELLQSIDAGLAEGLIRTGWRFETAGADDRKSIVEEPAHPDYEPDRAGSLPGRESIELTVIALAPFGKNIGRLAEMAVETVKPDIIAVDSSPVESCADIRYTFSLYSALGMPFNGNIINKHTGDIYSGRKFYPGNLFETAILHSWTRKIPLVPVGPPPKPVELVLIPNQGYVDLNYDETVKWEIELFRAYRILDQEMNGATDLDACWEAARKVNRSLLEAQNDEKREAIGLEASYIISRIVDIAAAVCRRSPEADENRLITRDSKDSGISAPESGESPLNNGLLPGQETCESNSAVPPRRKVRVLALIDAAHLADVEYYAGLWQKGRENDIYTRPSNDFNSTGMTLVVNASDSLMGTVQEYSPESTRPQELFRRQFEEYIKLLDNEITLSGAHELITQIAERTRSHPEIARGVSVRGTLACTEILQGLAELHGKLTRESIGKAALITLPPRISLKQKGDGTAIIRDLALEVLYNFSLYGKPEDRERRDLKGLSADDILGRLSDLEQPAAAQKAESGQGKSPAVISELERNREALKYLEKMNYVKRDAQNQYTLTRKALEFLLRDLEDKLQSGEITPDEYSQQKAALMQKMKNISEPQFRMSGGEIANTIMEMIDAQDKQWNSEINFDTMHVYYHIKENSENVEISPEKRDYYALRRLIDDMEKRKVLMAAANSAGFLLTGIALDMLLKYLLNRNMPSKDSRGITRPGGAWTSERNHEVRRYSSGDTFRDISIRHTLKQIARQKKSLKEIRNSDLRVYLKQPRMPHSDIILCLDTSGSMGFHQKLMYARLAAAGLVQAGLGEGNRVGIVAFNDHGQVTVPLTGADKTSLLNCIAALSARGNTNIGDGIRSSSELLFQSYSKNQKHIILISDGQPTAVSEKTFAKLKSIKERDLTEESALLETRQAAARGIQLSVIHIAAHGEPSDNFIRNIARLGKGQVRRVSGPEDLRGLLRR